MKRIGDYFLQITHLAFVEYNGKTYTREENIINGKISLTWTLKQLNEHGTWDDVEYVSDKKLLNVLNDEYDKMSYSENFK
jgi:hypothetical protein